MAYTEAVVPRIFYFKYSILSILNFISLIITLVWVGGVGFNKNWTKSVTILFSCTISTGKSNRIKWNNLNIHTTTIIARRNLWESFFTPGKCWIEDYFLRANGLSNKPNWTIVDRVLPCKNDTSICFLSFFFLSYEPTTADALCEKIFIFVYKLYVMQSTV